MKRHTPQSKNLRFHDLTNYSQKLRAFCGLTQAELARLLAVTQSCVAQWELGQRRPWPAQIAKIVAFAKQQGVKISEADILYWQPKEPKEKR